MSQKKTIEVEVSFLVPMKQTFRRSVEIEVPDEKFINPETADTPVAKLIMEEKGVEAFKQAVAMLENDLVTADLFKMLNSKDVSSLRLVASETGEVEKWIPLTVARVELTGEALPPYLDYDSFCPECGIDHASMICSPADVRGLDAELGFKPPKEEKEEEIESPKHSKAREDALDSVRRLFEILGIPVPEEEDKKVTKISADDPSL